MRRIVFEFCCQYFGKFCGQTLIIVDILINHTGRLKHASSVSLTFLLLGVEFEATSPDQEKLIDTVNLMGS